MSCSAEAGAPNPESSDQVGTATLEALARAARQVALYGSDHPIAVESLEQACCELEAAAGGDTLEVRAQTDGLLWNGIPLPSRDGNVARFHAGMRDRLIASVDMAPRVRTEDLARLLLLLASDAEEIAATGGALEAFGSNGGETVRIHEVDFTGDVLVSEAIWKQLSQGLDEEETGGLTKLIAACAHRLPPDDADAAAKSERAAAGDIGREQESAEEVVGAGIARLIQRAGEAHYFTDQKKWEEWRKATARQLAALSPRWRSVIFRAPAGVSSEYPDMLSLLTAEMEEADCISLVLGHPDSIRAERSDMLALALERILADRSRRKAIEAALHEKALQEGMPEAVYQNVVGLLVSRIEGKRGPEPQAASVHPWVGRVDGAPSETEDDLDDLLRTTEEQAVRRSRLSMLRESLYAHLTISQYGTVVSLLTKAAEECAARSDVEGLISVLSTLGRESGGRAGQDQSRRAVATSAVARASTEQVASALVTGLEGAPDDRVGTIVGLLGLLGEPGRRALVQLVRTGTDWEAELAMATLLERDGPEMSHLRDLVSQARGLTLERVLRALIDSRNEQTGARVRMVASEAGEEAQLQIVELIAEGGRKDLGEVLVALLPDSSRSVRLAAANAIAELGVRDAVPHLCGIVEREASFGEGARLKEAAVRTLGSLGAGSAVPALCSVLQGGALLSKLGSHRPRIAAAEALAALGGPDSREALEKGCRSMHPGVREACRRALSRLLAAERPSWGSSGGH